MKLGQFIKKVRKAKGLSQLTVARRAGIARSYISRLESDDFKKPSLDMLSRIATALGISIDTLLQKAGYKGKVLKKELPDLDIYLREKFNLTERAIEDVSLFVNFVKKKYLKEK